MKKFTITTDNAILYGNISGNPNAKDILVTLHGGPGGNKEDMQKLNVCQKLEQDHLLVYFDQRGCGESVYDLRLGLKLELLINDVKCMIDYIKALYPTMSVSLLGFSYGGFLGFSFLEKYPDSVTRYMACNPAITFSPQEAIAFTKRNQERYQKRFSTLQSTAINIVEAMESKEFIEFVFSSNNTSHSLRYVYAIKEWFFTKNFTNILKNITTPTLIQQGKLDSICDESSLHQALNTFQNKLIQYFCLDTCCHDIDDVNSDIVVKNIISFIKNTKKENYND